MKNVIQGMAARVSRFRFNTEAGQAGLSDSEGAGGSGEQTGGLKLMTVFIAVLALHLVVIGGISAWHFIKGPSASSDAPKEDAVANANTNATASDATDSSASDQASTDGTAPASKDANVPAQGSEVTGEKTSAPVAIPAVAAKPAAATAPKPVAVSAAPTPAQAAAPTMSGSGSSYVVKSGDTLHRIAKQYGMTVAQLKEMNHLTGDMLRIGQKLAVNAKAPAAPATAPAATPAPAPASVVATVATPTTASAPAMAAAAPAPTPAAQAPAGESRTYTVAKGDTLTKIAKQFKVTAAAIMSANSPKLSDPKKLKIGEVLTIPVKSDRHEVSQAPAPGSAVPTLRTTSPDLVMNK